MKKLFTELLWISQTLSGDPQQSSPQTTNSFKYVLAQIDEMNIASMHRPIPM